MSPTKSAKPSPTKPSKQPAVSSGDVKGLWIVEQPYPSTYEDEFTLKVGQIYEAIEQEDEGDWWKGRLKGSSSQELKVFSTAYMKKYVQTAPEENPRPISFRNSPASSTLAENPAQTAAPENVPATNSGGEGGGIISEILGRLKRIEASQRSLGDSVLNLKNSFERSLNKVESLEKTVESLTVNLGQSSGEIMKMHRKVDGTNDDLRSLSKKVNEGFAMNDAMTRKNDEKIHNLSDRIEDVSVQAAQSGGANASDMLEDIKSLKTRSEKLKHTILNQNKFIQDIQESVASLKTEIGQTDTRGMHRRLASVEAQLTRLR